MRSVAAGDFDAWRAQARALLAEDIEPARVTWFDTAAGQRALPGVLGEGACGDAAKSEGPRVSREFVERARVVACHRDGARWGLLYRVAWRLTHGEPEFLRDALDDDARALALSEHDVRRDAHKTQAFVRFRRVERDGGEYFVAWHRPEHRVLPLVEGFFARRFRSMRWSILTPDATVHWDGRVLVRGEGTGRAAAPENDALEELWGAYYTAIFNPARIKLGAMRKEMPVRHWATLPETRVISRVLRDAPERVERMMRFERGSDSGAREWVPRERSLPVLRAAADECRGCGLHEHATQTVFGEGPPDARVMLVGEQPGDEEDLAGSPFVGPAGRVLDGLMREVGLDRSAMYMTNAVKHFKFTREGKARIHQKPGAGEVRACRAWLDAELEVVKPTFILCLGATAGRSFLGPAFRLGAQLGQTHETPWARWMAVTYHPSAVLRAPDERAAAGVRAQLAADLARLAEAMR